MARLDSVAEDCGVELKYSDARPLRAYKRTRPLSYKRTRIRNLQVRCHTNAPQRSERASVNTRPANQSQHVPTSSYITTIGILGRGIHHAHAHTRCRNAGDVNGNVCAISRALGISPTDRVPPLPVRLLLLFVRASAVRRTQHTGTSASETKSAERRGRRRLIVSSRPRGTDTREGDAR